jgi:hypothetical protein
MLRGMNRTLGAASLGLLACLLVVSGCGGGAGQADRVAADFLGPETVYVLSAPDRVQGWNFQRPDGSIAGDPPIRTLDRAVGEELGKVLLREETYKTPAGGGGFERAVGFKLWRGGQSVEVYLSFVNDLMYLRYGGLGGSQPTSFSGVGAAHDELLRLAKRAFPEYRPPR